MKTKKVLLGLLCAAALWSCEKDESIEEVTQESKNFVSKNLNGTIIQVEDLGEGIYLYGDIKIVEDQFLPIDTVIDLDGPPNLDVTKLNQGGNIRKWSNNTIVYSIESNFSPAVRSEIQASMDEWSNKTDIRFVERTNEQDYVRILSNGNDCNCGSAYLGVVRFNGFIGTIELGLRSTKSVITHEIGHTLGYTHEQNREDRDQYITVIPQNIDPNGLSQYNRSVGSIPLTAALDYNSIMMYTFRTFGNGNGPTMTRNDNGQPVQGSQGVLTTQDVAGTNVAYPPIDPDVVTDPDPTDPCEGVAEYVRRRYNVGDRVTFRGFLFEREQFRWRRIGPCGTGN